MKSFFILPLNVHLIKLLKLKATSKLSMMKLYLKQHKDKKKKKNTSTKIKTQKQAFDENTSIAKSLVSEALAVISGCCND